MKHQKLYNIFKERVAPSLRFRAVLGMTYELYAEKGLVLCTCDGKEFANASGTIEQIRENLLQTLPNGNDKNSLMEKLDKLPNSLPWMPSVPVVFISRNGWSYLRIATPVESMGRN